MQWQALKSRCPAGHGALSDLRPLPACRTCPEPSWLTFMRAPFNGVGASNITHRYAIVRESDKKSVTLMASLAYARSVRYDYAVVVPATHPFRFAWHEWFRTSVTGWAVMATAAFAKAAPDPAPNRVTWMPLPTRPPVTGARICRCERVFRCKAITYGIRPHRSLQPQRSSMVFTMHCHPVSGWI